VGKIRAGFASPAADYLNESIDLNRLLIRQPEYTFIGQAKGNSMVGDFLRDGAIVVIDRSLESRDKDIVLCFIDEEYTMKHVRMDKENKMVRLMAANPDFPEIRVTEENQFVIWGVVTSSITRHRK
jgi:DNA polymerase V